MWLPDTTVDLPTVPMLTGRKDATDRVVALRPDLILDCGAISPRYVQLIEAVQMKTGIPRLLWPRDKNRFGLLRQQFATPSSRFVAPRPVTQEAGWMAWWGPLAQAPGGICSAWLASVASAGERNTEPHQYRGDRRDRSRCSHFPKRRYAQARSRVVAMAGVSGRTRVPPSINRLLGLAVLSARGGGTVGLAG
jgi:hypothetical protein